MNRRDFIKSSCIACSSISFTAVLLQSCTAVRHASGELVENGLLVGLDNFVLPPNGFRTYLIVRHDELQYPICIYRLNANEFSALYMQCTHQGTELQVSGDLLTCPAHGSEFDKFGKVVQAPAASDLRSFPVTIVDNKKLFIDLRKQS